MRASPHSGAQRQLQYLALLLAATLIFGVNWPVMKAGLAYVDPIWMGAIRLTSAAGFVVAINLTAGKLSLPLRRDWPAVLIVGLFHFAGMPVLAGLSVHFVSPAVAAACLYTTPLWLYLIAWTRGRARGSGFGAVAITLTGLAAIAWGGRSGELGADYALGIAAGLGGSCCTALSIDFIRRYDWTVEPLRLMPWQLIVAGAPTLILAFAFKGPPPDALIGWRPAALLFFTGPLTTGFAGWGLIVASRRLPSLFVGSVSALTPAIGLIATHLMLSEQLRAELICGVFLILAGALWHVLGTSRAGRLEAGADHRKQR